MAICDVVLMRSDTMKRTTATFSFIFFLMLSSLLVWIGLDEIAIPFMPLEDRVRLLAYPNYIAITACSIVFPLFLLCCIYSIFTAKKPSPKVWKYFYIAFIVGFLGIIPRYQLGTRVDDAGYVKCVKESRTSTTNSWRVYAKSLDLCKESSGIAGG